MLLQFYVYTSEIFVYKHYIIQSIMKTVQIIYMFCKKNKMWKINKKCHN